MDAAWEGPGTLVGSGEFDGLDERGGEGAHRRRARGARARAGRRVTYRLRDWGISRQRYWGAPIPVVYCDALRHRAGAGAGRCRSCCPRTSRSPGAGGSPLADACGVRPDARARAAAAPARRETDTMDTFVESSWYFLRYVLAARRRRARSTRDELALLARDAGVDQYIGGIEHAVLHLLYSRFFTKVLRDLGFVAARRAVPRACSRRAW